MSVKFPTRVLWEKLHHAAHVPGIPVTYNNSHFESRKKMVRNEDPQQLRCRGALGFTYSKVTIATDTFRKKKRIN